MVSIAALFIALIPLFSVNCVQGHDISYHLLRIEALKEGILSGHPFSKVNFLFFGGRGYASSMFYPDALLYFPAILRCLGVSINASYHIFVAACIILSYVSMYLVVRLITSHFLKEKDDNKGRKVILLRGSDVRARAAGVMAALCYTLSQYHVDDIYTRAAVGEFTAMIFLPFAIYGLYDILMGGMKRPAIMALGMAGLILTHTTTTIFVLVLYVLCFIYALARRSIRGRLRMAWIMRIVLTAAFVLAVTSFYWVGALEQFLDARFGSGQGIFDMDYEKLMVFDLFLNRNPAFGIALPLVWFVAMAFFVYVMGGEKKLRLLSLICSVTAFVFLFGSTGLLPWKYLDSILGFMQFPWRFLIMSTALLSVSAALAFSSAVHDLDRGLRSGVSVLAVLLVFCVMAFSFFSNLQRMEKDYYSYSDDYYSYIPFTGSVIGGEWLPVTVKDRDALLKDCDMAVTDYGGRLQVERSEGGLKVSMPSSAGFVDVPFIYYKGYEARTQEGRVLELDGSGENGSVRVYSPPEGIITVRYKGTGAQKASMAVSILAFLAAVFLYGSQLLFPKRSEGK